MSYRHLMVAKFLDHNKLWSCKYGGKKRKKLTCMRFLCIIALSRNKMVANAFLSSFDNANGHLCQERMLRSRNFDTMVN